LSKARLGWKLVEDISHYSFGSNVRASPSISNFKKSDYAPNLITWMQARASAANAIGKVHLMPNLVQTSTAKGQSLMACSELTGDVEAKTMLYSYFSSGSAIPELCVQFFHVKEEVVPTEPEENGSNGEGSDNARGIHPDFMTYAPPPHVVNVDLQAEGGLEFSKLPHRRLGHVSSSLNVGYLQVGMEFFSKDAFVVVMKRYNIKCGVNFLVTKSR
ncbi:hypothetical protein Gotur_035499, partial [Gossypium turneri]